MDTDLSELTFDDNIGDETETLEFKVGTLNLTDRKIDTIVAEKMIQHSHLVELTQ